MISHIVGSDVLPSSNKSVRLHWMVKHEITNSTLYGRWVLNILMLHCLLSKGFYKIALSLVEKLRLVYGARLI